DESGEPARVFVMDEPTAALTAQESQRLFRIVAALRARGCGVLYVSHRLDEVLTLADRITVLRDGQTAATLDAETATKAALIAAMTGGRAIDSAGGPAEASGAAAALTVEALSGEGLDDVAFTLGRGEILGVAGLAGAGAERLTRALVNGAGRLRLDGKPAAIRSPADAWAQGVALCPRERRAQGLLLMQDVARNIALPHLSRLNRWRFFLDRRRELGVAVEAGQRVRLKARGPRQKVRTLSGGNQQKAMFARAIAGPLRVLLLDEPTRGVDVGAKFDIYALLRELARAGAGVLVASSDQEELLHICSRILGKRVGGGFDSADAAGALLRRKLMARFLSRFGTPLGFLLLIAFFGFELPGTFFTSRNLINISQQMSMLAVVSATMTVVMAMGDFDLSVGSIASLAGIVAAIAFVAGAPPLVAVPLALAVGLAAGLVNGFLVAYVGIMPFI